MSKDPSSAEVLTEVLQHLCDENDGKPPSPAQLAAALDMPVKVAKQILKELTEDGVLPVNNKRSADAAAGSEVQPDQEDPGLASESAPKAPKIPKRLKPYVAEKAVTPDLDQMETQEFDIEPSPASTAAPASGTKDPPGTEPTDESVAPVSSRPSKAMEPSLPKGDSQRQGPPNAPCIFCLLILLYLALMQVNRHSASGAAASARRLQCTRGHE